MEPVRIWIGYKPLFPDAAKLRPHISPAYDIVLASGSKPDPNLQGAQIAFGQPDPQQVMTLNSLRWIHVHTAGYTKYDREDVKSSLRSRGAVLTNSSSVYAEPCAQHVLAMMLALARKLPQSLGNQLFERGWPCDEIRAQSVLISGQKVLLVGFGSIGHRL